MTILYCVQASRAAKPHDVIYKFCMETPILSNCDTSFEHQKRFSAIMVASNTSSSEIVYKTKIQN